jgi:hypothetical protein
MVDWLNKSINKIDVVKHLLLRLSVYSTWNKMKQNQIILPSIYSPNSVTICINVQFQRTLDYKEQNGLYKQF